MELITEPMFQHAHVKATHKAGRKLVAYTKMVVGLIYLGAFVVLGGKYNYSISLTDECLCRNGKLGLKPVIRILTYLLLVVPILAQWSN